MVRVVSVHRSCRAALVLAPMLSILLAAPASRADGSATADALFRDGRKAIAEEDWARAATVFAESQRLDPAPGTLLNLAMAEEKLGHLAAAWEHARSARDGLLPSDDRAKLARELYEALDAKLPTIVLRPSPGFSAQAAVTLDGAEVRPASFGVALPLDPGAHEIVVQSPSRAKRSVVVRIKEGERVEETVREGAPIGEVRADRETVSRPWRTVGWGSLGASGALVVAGTVLGAFAIDRNGSVEDHCAGKLCDRVGADAAAEGRTFATASTVMFATAGAFVVAGAALLLFAPR
jgi:hypothetical protein